MKRNSLEIGGHYKHIQGDTIHKGYFSIYQARHGGIMLAMNNGAIELKEKQIQELGIDVYSIHEFDYELYKDRYTCKHPINSRVTTDAGHTMCVDCKAVEMYDGDWD